MNKELILVGESQLKCDKGSSLSALVVTSQQFSSINGHYKATDEDKIANENIFPFGICSITQKPCILNLTEWEHKISNYTVNGNAILTEKSFIPCKLGGIVKPEILSQQFHYISYKEIKIYSKNGNDLGIVDVFITDENNERIEVTEPNKIIFLHLETENMIGKYVTIDLSNDRIDYLFEGKHLENDILPNIYVSNDKMIFKLTTIKQK